MKLTSFLYFLTFVSSIYGFKVLGVLPFGSKSHFAIGNAIMETLHGAGHEITLISPYPRKTPIQNFRDISLADWLEKYQKGKINYDYECKLILEIL